MMALTAASLAVLSPVASASPPHTGLEGQTFLYISYGTPIEIEPGVWIGIGNVQLPVASTFSVLSAQNHREVARVTTDSNGLYSVSLPPGRYLVVSDPISMSPFAHCTASLTPFEVTVHAKQFTLANIFYYRQGPCAIRAPVQPQPFTPPAPDPELKTDEGHHQSGITGSITSIAFGVTYGVGARLIPYRVRVYTDTFPHELVAEVEAEISADTWWQQQFEVHLKPGRYFAVAYLPPAPEDGGRTYTFPANVTVEKKQFTDVTFSFVPYSPVLPVIPTGSPDP
jgi:hypothetical protein